jgi:nucleotide-binding universal stress UspA family protein
MKILVPVDGSNASQVAINALIEFVRGLRDAPQIELLYVSLPIRPSPTINGIALDRELIDKHHREEARQVMTAVQEKLGQATLPHNANSAVGDIAEEICKSAAQKQCNMIWMGTRGMGGFANLLLGSVATKVLHRANVPVVLVPVHSPQREHVEPNDFRT